MPKPSMRGLSLALEAGVRSRATSVTFQWSHLRASLLPSTVVASSFLRIQCSTEIVLAANPFETLVLTDGRNLDWATHCFCPREESREPSGHVHHELCQVNRILKRHRRPS